MDAKKGFSTYERFTQASIIVIMLAQEEAKSLGHNFVSIEHIFLGLIGEGKGIAAQELKKTGMTLRDARSVVKDILAPFERVEKWWWEKFSGPFREMTYKENAKQMLLLAWNESSTLNVTYMGTEHLLLGLLRLDEEDPLEIFTRFKTDKVRLRESILSTIRARDWLK